MNLKNTLRRLPALFIARMNAAHEKKRRTLALPAIQPYYGIHRDVLPKPTPHNLRRFAETPIARKAINVVKDRVAGRCRQCVETRIEMSLRAAHPLVQQRRDSRHIGRGGRCAA